MILFYACLFSILSNSLFYLVRSGLDYFSLGFQYGQFQLKVFRITTRNKIRISGRLAFQPSAVNSNQTTSTTAEFPGAYPASNRQRAYVLGALYMNKKAASITTDMKRSGTEAHKKLQDELCESVSKGFNTDSLLATSLLQCQLSQVGNHDVETALDFNGNNLKLNNLDVRDKALQNRIKNAVLSYTPSAYYYYGSVSQVNGVQHPVASSILTSTTFLVNIVILSFLR
ncbi:hypothetical protein D915_008270 [Fasciola hepatica]|uniref:Uncharacterized protein n=1 Tax=Fasciola hepatica TaxID=6192 RepID=A0A4E0R3L8_FASHE|nr:hypothetical protein D915_008270 [Fasciola hepatica]